MTNLNISGSIEKFNQAVTCIPGGVSSPVRAFKQVGGKPVYINSGSGSKIVDIDGNTYIDFCSSWGPLILGHAHPKVVKAVTDTAARGLTFGTCHELEIVLARLILDGYPEYNRVRFVNSGTEAVMTALRLARGITGKKYVIKFEGGYHGHFDGMLVKAGSGLATHGIASSKGIPGDIAQTTLVAPLNDPDTIQALFQRHGDDIAAVIIEPVPANNGLLIQDVSFMKMLREVTQSHGSLLIFDEVITGFRFRYGGYGTVLDIKADLVTLGKIIGGGMPIGAVMGPEEKMRRLSPEGDIYQAGTLSGNPVSLAAGAATLKELRDNPPYEQLEEHGRIFTDALERSGIPHARAVRMGSIVWPYFDDSEFPKSASDISATAMKRFTKIYSRLLENRFYLPPSSFEMLFINAAHTRSDVENLAGVMVEELQRID